MIRESRITVKLGWLNFSVNRLDLSRSGPISVGTIRKDQSKGPSLKFKCFVFLNKRLNIFDIVWLCVV